MYPRHHYNSRDLIPATRTPIHTINNRNYRSNGIGSQQYSPVRRYFIFGSFSSIDKKFIIYGNGYKKGNEQYRVRGGRLFGGINNLLLEDRFGTPLIRIEKESGHVLRSPYKLLSHDGYELARIKKHFRGYDFEIDTVYGPYQFILEDNPKRRSYSVLNAQNQVIGRREGGVEVAANQDQAFVLALIIVISHFLPIPPSNKVSAGGYGGH